MTSKMLTIIFFVLWVTLGIQEAAIAQSLSVYAATSLRDVLNEIGTTFEKENQLRHRIQFNYSGSNELAHQIVATPGADLYLSANEDWMDYIEKQDRIIPNTRRNIVTNRLVFVGHRSSNLKIQNAADLITLPFKHLSIADPRAVPAGKYAKGYLSGIKLEGKSLWDILASKVAPALDVRAALTLVETDPSVIGIVYNTDAMTSKNTKVLFEIPQSQVPPVHYVVAQIKKKNPPVQAQKFYDYLFSDSSLKTFQKYGFSSITPTKK